MLIIFTLGGGILILIMFGFINLMKNKGWGMSYSKSFLGIMGLIVVLVAFVGSYGYLVSRLPSETLFVIERGVDSFLVIIGIGGSIVGLIRRNFYFFYGLMAVLVGLYFIYRGPAMFGVN